MIKVLALRERFEHMSQYSGYDALYNHLPADVNADSIFANFKKIYPRGIGRLLKTASKLAGKSVFYNAQSVEAESKLLYRSAVKKYDIVHYTYGEPYFGIGAALKKTSKPALVLTNHQPVSWWGQHEKLFKKHVKADRVITLSIYDMEYFNSHVPGKAVCIPHGVDIDFYKPLAIVADEKDKPFKVIFTGRYLRDMAVLAGVIKMLSASAMDFYFDVVYLDQKDVWQPFLTEIMNLPNVNWYANVTEHELLSLYQQADCCLIPLEDCTANNAILEAMACGLPIVSTDLPAIKTYLDDSMSIFGRKGNAGDLCGALIGLYNNRDKKKAMALAARNKAVREFDWNIIAAQTTGLFKSL